ncbi:hypothetical protein MKEN_01061000 [Mycena kentingensis (nom. inval.)]|nr:hypothetical protein MKEN_01061000 [Mycena kentingensis (nom. inval.)]
MITESPPSPVKREPTPVIKAESPPPVVKPEPVEEPSQAKVEEDTRMDVDEPRQHNLVLLQPPFQHNPAPTPRLNYLFLLVHERCLRLDNERCLHLDNLADTLRDAGVLQSTSRAHRREGRAETVINVFLSAGAVGDAEWLQEPQHSPTQHLWDLAARRNTATPTMEPLPAPVPEKRPEPTVPLPPIPPWEPGNKAERAEMAQQLAAGAAYRAGLKGQYADPRQVLHELEMSTMDLHASEMRSATARVGVDLARAGKLGMEYQGASGDVIVA